MHAIPEKQSRDKEATTVEQQQHAAATLGNMCEGPEEGCNCIVGHVGHDDSDDKDKGHNSIESSFSLILDT